MKTAQIMVKDLNGIPIRQNHLTKMFNSNDLLNAYRKRKPRSRKVVSGFMRSKSTKEYISYLCEKAYRAEKSNYSKNATIEISSFDSLLDLDCKENYMKTVMITSTGRVNGGTWMSPSLFIDFAMWLSVEFKDWVIECATDRLLESRDEAGDSFKEVNKALSTEDNVRGSDFINEAFMINELVFGKRDGGQRNGATQSQLELLGKLQKADIKLIKKGLRFRERKDTLTELKDLLTN